MYRPAHMWFQSPSIRMQAHLCASFESTYTTLNCRAIWLALLSCTNHVTPYHTSSHDSCTLSLSLPSRGMGSVELKSLWHRWLHGHTTHQPTHSTRVPLVHACIAGRVKFTFRYAFCTIAHCISNVVRHSVRDLNYNWLHDWNLWLSHCDSCTLLA